MKKQQTAIINKPWPPGDLESVSKCPYCGARYRKLAYQDVQDWSFYAAPGKWTYWECDVCQALYLDPRPTENSMVRAYSNYYTHSSLVNQSSFGSRLKNQCYSHWMGVDIQPRLNLPKVLSPLLLPLKLLLSVPFGLDYLACAPKGSLLDIGSGGGETLRLAKQLGWQVKGLEIDPEAVRCAREQGLNVVLGSVRELDKMQEEFDCIVCSHVLEHVHDPADLLGMMAKRLRTGGVMLLALPNANSHVRKRFGKFWRGLEAPRHVSIPTLDYLKSILGSAGFVEITQTDIFGVTAPESKMMMAGDTKVSWIEVLKFRLKKMFRINRVSGQSDFIQISAKKLN